MVRVCSGVGSADAVVTVRASFFFFNDTATTEIYTLSLHDALPIFIRLPVTHHLLHRACQLLEAEGLGQEMNEAVFADVLGENVLGIAGH